MKDKILKYALQNAVKFRGKASVGAVVGKVLAENPELKNEAKKVNAEIKKVVDRVNCMKPEEQEKELEKYKDELVEREKGEKDIFSVFNIQKGDKVVTCFPPEPSKYPHIGHAKSLLLNYELAKRFKGKFILRFEDTNPKLVTDEFCKIHLDNYKWLGIKADGVVYASDYVEKFYELAEKMLGEGNAYVCTCAQETIKENRTKGKECKCRSLGGKERLDRFKSLFKEGEGRSVLRLKGDMKHDNTVMRDPTLLRVIKHKHPRHGSEYSVWPTYDFENAVMDGLQGITHRLRTKEFELRNELQGFIQKILGFKQTRIYEFARFNMEGVESSGRKIRDLINEGKLVGWDDPSLTTIVALKRRGFVPEAIKNFVLSTGITKSESTLTWDDLVVHNKRVLDAKANRYFFIKNAKEVKIENAPEQVVKLKLHPEHPDRGFRKFETKDTFYVEKEDFGKFREGCLYRLMDCLNFRKKKGKFVFDSLEHSNYKKEGDMIIHWLPKSKGLISTEVLMPDKKLVEGIAEPNVRKVKAGEVMQFARFGFCRLDEKKKTKLRFWFTHK